jgi:antitoxin PrlF
MEMSRLTSKYQATVPADVRAALRVGAGDRLGWTIEDGTARVCRVEEIDGWPFAARAAAVDSLTFGEWLSDEDDDLVRGLV